jgi:phage shock protein PspC (stress-responsive transcriptional regulator)
MYCTNCGVHTDDTDNFCRQCGRETPVGHEAARANHTRDELPRRLYRVTSDKKIAGVCSGLARYLEVDVTVVRLVVVAGALFSGGLLLVAYVLAWIVMPPEVHVTAFHSPASAPPQTAS